MRKLLSGIILLGLSGTAVMGSEVDTINTTMVKLSKSDICHAPDSPSYNRTKNFTPYDNISECLNSGPEARLPKNYTPTEIKKK